MLLPRSTSEPPQLTIWQQVWRYVFAVVVGGLFFADIAPEVWNNDPALVVLDVALGVASVVLLGWRRRYPVTVAAIIGAAGVFSTSSVGALIVALVSLSTYRRWRQIIPVALLSLLAGIAYTEVQPTEEAPWWLVIAFNVVSVAVVVATGLYIGARRELMATLHERAERAEREQGMRVSQARANERSRIAREMHDVLAHRISLVAMHAGALSYRSDLAPEDIRGTAAIIQSSAHDALTDLREVLGLLRGSSPGANSEGAPERPQPTLCDIPDLIEEARSAGMRVSLNDDVHDPELAPEAIGRSAYRMVQESLTNARKHAPDTSVEVILRGEAGDQLFLEVRNPMRLGGDRPGLPDSGLGLLGLAERAALVGGRLEQETTRDRQFVVRAWLPWPK